MERGDSGLSLLEMGLGCRRRLPHSTECGSTVSIMISSTSWRSIIENSRLREEVDLLRRSHCNEMIGSKEFEVAHLSRPA